MIVDYRQRLATVVWKNNPRSNTNGRRKQTKAPPMDGALNVFNRQTN